MRGGSSTVSRRSDRGERAHHRRLLCLVRGEHHGHQLAGVPSALNHGLHGDLLVAQTGGDAGNHTRLVHHHQANVVGADVVVHGPHRRPGRARRRGGKRRHDLTAGDVHEVGDHGRCGRPGTGAGAFEERTADPVALRHHGVEHTVDAGDGRRLADHAGVHPLRDRGFVGAGYA